ncbi:MAG: hypothetical protein ACREI2_10525 [Nitrospiraceae bacterium]
MKARQKKAVSAKGDLFALAEAVSLMYGQDAAEAATEELREVALDYRAVVKARGQHELLSYVLRLLLACPVLLTRPPGFEWVTDDLRWALQHRRFNPDVDRDLWGAFAEVRGRLTSGRPGNKAKDLFRYEMVHAIMHPVTTDPEKGLIRVKGCSKTAAVQKLAEIEECGGMGENLTCVRYGGPCSGWRTISQK